MDDLITDVHVLRISISSQLFLTNKLRLSAWYCTFRSRPVQLKQFMIVEATSLYGCCVMKSIIDDKNDCVIEPEPVIELTTDYILKICMNVYVWNMYNLGAVVLCKFEYHLVLY